MDRAPLCMRDASRAARLDGVDLFHGINNRAHWVHAVCGCVVFQSGKTIPPASTVSNQKYYSGCLVPSRGVRILFFSYGSPKLEADTCAFP